MPYVVQDVILVGFGAIGRSIFQRLVNSKQTRVTHIVVSKARVTALQAELGDVVHVVDAIPAQSRLVLECAGHSALTQHIMPALARGIECGVLSAGALSSEGLYEQLVQAAEQGRTQVHLLSGAIGGIDAISAARLNGLTEVTYTGRKPPSSWRGSPAEQIVNLDNLEEPTVILQATAREAARLYPKNANVAATVSLAGIGLDATQVRLIADPSATENFHEIVARGAFGEMHLTMRGNPLSDNPKTSMLTVLSALRFLHNRCSAITL
jgi:aspartate dehydrogenase